MGAQTDKIEGQSHVRAVEVARAQNPGSEGNVLDKQLARILAQTSEMKCCLMPAVRASPCA
jgi:hypothetical protein